MSSVIKTLGKIGGAVAGVFAPFGKAIDSFQKGEVGKGIASLLVPGYASVQMVKDADSIKSDQEIWEDVRKTDLNGDGVTWGDNIDSVVEYVDDTVVKPVTEYKKNKEQMEILAELENSEQDRSSSAGLIGWLAPIAGVALLFLL